MNRLPTPRSKPAGRRMWGCSPGCPTHGLEWAVYADLPSDIRDAHPYHMYEEILAQPEAVRRSLEAVASEGRAAARAIGHARRVWVTGCGTSFFAADVGAWMLRLFTRGSVDARAVPAYDLVTYLPGMRPDDVVVAVSHSGGTTMTVRALERARRSGVESVLITGFPDAEASRLATYVVATGYPEERSWAHTVSYTAALAAFAGLANMLAVSEEELDLAPLPDLLRDVLGLEEMAHRLAGSAVLSERFSGGLDVVLAGGGPNAVTAREGVLKLLETSYSHAQAFDLEETLHGPLAAVTPETLFFLIAPAGRSTERAAELLGALREIGVTPVVVCSEGNAPAFEEAHRLLIPDLPEALSPIATVLPLQLFAYFLAVGKGINPDLLHRDDERYRRARAQYR